jgi:non-lysosomal glucosylceramidase
VLDTIFKANVMEFGDGKLGAVNGMTKSGQLEIVSMQSEEIWTGVTYGLSSTMMMEVEYHVIQFIFLFVFLSESQT